MIDPEEVAFDASWAGRLDGVHDAPFDPESGARQYQSDAKAVAAYRRAYAEWYANGLRHRAELLAERQAARSRQSCNHDHER